MKPDEIKKALECCSEHEGCYNCPCYSECGDLSVVTTEALNYINKLEAEKKEITEKFNCQQTVYADLSKIIKDQQAEIERLTEVKNQLERDIINEQFNYKVLKENYDEQEQQLHYLSNVEIPYLYSFTEDKDKKLETLANILISERKKAIKEFVEELREIYRNKLQKYYCTVSHTQTTVGYTIDDVLFNLDILLKEKVGENNEQMGNFKKVNALFS